MRILIGLLLLFIAPGMFAQENANLKKGFAAEGYDVVAYFNNEALEGNSKFTTTHEGIKYKFHSLENLSAFQKNPTHYVPQYGGFCAYAIADSGKKVGVNPKTFLIQDNKLYLFYNNWGTNTLEKWNEQGAEKLQKKADTAWKTIIMEGS